MHIQQRSGYHSDLRNIKSAIRPLSELENDMKSLSEFTTRKKIADFAGMIAFDKDDEEILLWKTQRSKSG
jgi:DNA polymerase-3 subunit epsilon